MRGRPAGTFFSKVFEASTIRSELMDGGRINMGRPIIYYLMKNSGGECGLSTYVPKFVISLGLWHPNNVADIIRHALNVEMTSSYWLYGA